ncbi:MAG: NAD-dependent epimerase/dehydratase family protein, partial [Proteobacteria bacterium]
MTTSRANVLVVGGAGYIGSHVAHDLVEAGHRVKVFDNLSSGAVDNVPKGAEFVIGDLRRGGALEESLASGIDIVFHFAARKAAGESMEVPHGYADNNIVGTLRLLRLMHETGVRRFVFSSSAAVYGSPVTLPIDEEHPTKPENYYG